MEFGDVEGNHFYGGTLSARLSLVQSRHGKDGVAKLFEQMAKNGYQGPRSVGEIKVKQRYPIKDLLIFFYTYEEIFGEKNLIELSRRAPRKKGIVGWFVRWGGSPELLFKKAMEYWPQFYDFGELNGKVVEEGKGILIGKDICTVSPVLCKALTPYFKGVIENIKVKNVKCEHTKCQYTGDEFGEWTVAWDKSD